MYITNTKQTTNITSNKISYEDNINKYQTTINNVDFQKHNRIYDEEKTLLCLYRKQSIPVQQVYPGKCNDRIIYYTHKCSKYPSKNICLTNKLTGKVLTDYTSQAKELLTYMFETPHGQKQYKKRMLMVKPRFAYNKYTLKYRQYHILGLENAKMQQALKQQHKT